MLGKKTQVYMERSLLLPIPTIKLPLSYEIKNFKNGNQYLWTNIQNKIFKDKRRKFQDVFSEADKDGIYLAFYKNRPIGIGAAVIRKTKKGNLFGFGHWIGVLDEFRGKGIGLALGIKILNYLKHKGFNYISLITPSYRKRAISIYEEFGFKIKFAGEEEEVRERQKMRADMQALRKYSRNKKDD